jgi:branched-chain amino acid transport system ATP-binding protein
MTTATTTAPALLKVEGLTVRFGGLVAVNEVSFELAEGELLGIIGPNGAGKTTAFNAIAGAVRPTSGTIRIGNSTVSGLPPERVARLGIARTFQTVRLFRSMTVEENIALGAIAVSDSMHAARARAGEISALLSMEHLQHKEVTELPLADQKRVEIARGLALSPKLLLLDEMMSGLNQTETRDIIGVIQKLNRQGLTIIVIEHVIRVIMELSHRVLVLDHGSLIAQGAPQVVMRDPHVVEAYLGSRAARGLGDSE